ncbi:DUF2787 family protein [Vibrio parahaemolyticus]|nr:DUF2787 family protein [Vibrio parahaemolyticus]
MKVNYSELKAVFNLCSLEKLVAYHVDEIALNDELQSFTLRFSPSGQSCQPVDIRVHRSHGEAWKVRCLTTYDSEQNTEAYFHFHFVHGWFYQSDIGACELLHPEVCQLFQSWLKGFIHQLRNDCYQPPQLILLASSNSN